MILEALCRAPTTSTTSASSTMLPARRARSAINYGCTTSHGQLTNCEPYVVHSIAQPPRRTLSTLRPLWEPYGIFVPWCESCLLPKKVIQDALIFTVLQCYTARYVLAFLSVLTSKVSSSSSIFNAPPTRCSKHPILLPIPPLRHALSVKNGILQE